jgi:hypothetical protein
MRDKSNTLADPREALLKLQTSQIENRLPPPDAGELDWSSHFEALAGHSAWKLRLYDLIEAHYLKTPLRERQWFNVLDLAAECARDPRTTEIGNDKRNSMVDFLCRAINRGEFKDAKGRMQVANLHPSPHVSIRLELKWLDFDQLVAFAKQRYLFIRRKECIECFAQNNIDFPTAWLPSELAGADVPDIRNLPPYRPGQREPQQTKPPKQPEFEPPKRKRGEYHKPQRDRVKEKLKGLYSPDGKPPATATNSDIYQAVEREFKNDARNSLGIPSRRSILREAGRVK